MKRIVSAETKKKISLANKGKTSWAKGKKLSLEHRKNLSIARKLYFQKNPDAMSGENNPNFGKKFDEEYRKKLSDSHNGLVSGMNGKKHSESTKKKMSQSAKGRTPWNKGKKTPPDVRLKQSKVARGRKASVEARKNMSIAQLKAIKEGKKRIPSNGNFICGHFYSTKNKKIIHYRSSYELMAYNLLEVNNNVSCYRVEPLAIEYRMNGKTRLYIPDILILYKNGNKKIVEVKPKRMLSEFINKKKIAAAKEYCQNNNMEFAVWTEDRLFGDNPC